MSMCVFIVWYPLEFSRLHTIYTWYWNSLLYNLISSGEKSAFAQFAPAIANHYNLAFSFHQVPITAGWRLTAWYEKLAQHLYTWPWAYMLPLCESCSRATSPYHLIVLEVRLTKYQQINPDISPAELQMITVLFTYMYWSSSSTFKWLCIRYLMWHY